jgi:DNA-binding transcriptional ArsR family regulator
MVIDRQLQRTMLEKLAAAYPEELNIGPLALPEPAASANLKYLEDHGLVRLLAKTDAVIGMSYRVYTAEITAKGLDFLADDGGLSAILDTVTVRLHADTLRELVAARIDASDLPAVEKARTISLLRALPAEAMKHLTKRLLDAALDRLPDAIALLQKLIAGAGP